MIGEYDEIDLPEVKPIIKRHRRLKCCCAQCGKTSAALLPQAAHGTPFGKRIHALALYLKSNQLFSYERHDHRELARDRDGGSLEADLLPELEPPDT